MKPTEYDDAMARARATLADLNRAAAELSRADQDPDVAATVLEHLRDDLHRHHCATDAPSVPRTARR
ncbi:hypothetical protein FZI85_15050 [Mycobacterium sp. CBMA293]|uniref:hypothetical protein n=1 Tax=unclassified Mycolicibacterium TaxID=2636767 RepID=UPI0012DFE034|nr:MULTISPECIES: hypothetical protein [unclassified Mycolicibacterium]MUL46724.1 hypothetical protein [Mycolicibacterium sp. CBMA 360]MUL57492.1 hypothetical protein [Mycolicibacterium sp. CBMA 335]MUL70532.1 hypothetical protein [Mycolicibacterium sp. CBMA 311]MUL92580.1 hypothetical protein [Mycolicibacterium sp. CBMA 230]MUM04956.1 hypothetical protein [Mycolicibacterium sp. CBMA 213]